VYLNFFIATDGLPSLVESSLRYDGAGLFEVGMKNLAVRMKRFRTRAYALVVVLGLTLLLAIISLSIIKSQSAFSSNVGLARRDLSRAILIQNTRASLGLRINDKVNLRDSVRLDKNFDLKEESETLRVRWKGRTDSVHRPLQSGYANGETLFEPEKFLPFTGYGKWATEPACGDIVLPPSHTAVGFDFGGTKERYRTVFSGCFPYALSAPRGSIRADAVRSFSNYTYAESEEGMGPETGLAAWVMAEGLLDIDDFQVGRAISNEGPINVEGGALALRVPKSTDQIGRDLSTHTTNAAGRISKDTLDKTDAIVGHVLSPQAFLALLKGDFNIWRMASAQQATMVPFYPFPTLQSKGIVKVIQLHNPWPPDFRTGQGNELREKLRNVTATRDGVEKTRKEKRGRDAELLRLILDNPDSPRRPQWEAERAMLRKEIFELAGQIIQLNKQIGILKTLIDKEAEWGGVRGVAPRHSGTYHTEGWAYSYPLQEGLELLIKAFTPGVKLEDLLARLSNQTRLFHFGGRDPEWFYPDGEPKISDGHRQIPPASPYSKTLSMKGTMTVPVGRTLKLTENTQIRGDLWLQKGSTLHIAGHLEVRPPAAWTDRWGKSVTPLEADFPNGRLMIEEGATLIVDGDLRCMGGIPEYGSILVVGPLDRVHPISSAIIAKGDIVTRHGIHPATNINELFAHARRKDSSYAPALQASEILTPLFSNFSRLFGPFEQRDCYFADFNSNFTFVITKFGPVPVPAPLPYGNCMKGLFDALSWISSAQLNMRLGPYFYTQSEYWLFGRGVTSVMIKTKPEVMMRLLDPLRNMPNLGNIDFLPVFEKAIRDMVTTVIVKVGVKFLTKAVMKILGSKVPGSVACLPWSDSKPNPNDTAKKFFKGLMKKIGQKFFKVVKQVLNKVRSEARRHYVGNPDIFTKELPGVYIYSGKNMSIGTSWTDSIMATGFFVAEGDIRFQTRRTVGTAISRRGDITAHQFLYYPFYASASLYEPLKPKDYKIAGSIPSGILPADELKDIFEIGLPVNRGKPIELQAKGSRVLFEGWTR
jgi:hypothetical protein